MRLLHTTTPVRVEMTVQPGLDGDRKYWAECRGPPPGRYRIGVQCDGQDVPLEVGQPHSFDVHEFINQVNGGEGKGKIRGGGGGGGGGGHEGG